MGEPDRDLVSRLERFQDVLIACVCISVLQIVALAVLLLLATRLY